jgi:hypothetical protein
MDQKNQGNQRQGNQQSGQQQTQQNQPTTQNPNRDPAEGPRHQQMPGQNDPGSHREQTRGNDDNRGNRRQYDEKNRGEGISNRGMEREMEEQGELPSRGSSQFDESESDSER